MSTINTNCLFCLNKIERGHQSKEGLIRYYYTCPNCGKYQTTDFSEMFLNELTRDNKNKAILSHAVYKMQKPNTYPLIDQKKAEQILENNTILTPAEQAENFILWLGDETKNECGELHQSAFPFAAIGTPSSEAFVFIVDHLEAQGLIRSSFFNEELGAMLTFDGWQKYEELKRTKSDSRKAFMAMPFKDRHLKTLFPAFKEAVSKTGFTLFHLGEDHEAGIMDNKLRVAIRSSRFIITDLTDENRGAYWEAGFAEGLGKPVIYSCEQRYFNENKTHFDTNHLHTILWEEDKLGDSTEELKATIRATLPEESIMEDKTI